jgi:hypothetical protein
MKIWKVAIALIVVAIAGFVAGFAFAHLIG